MNCLTCDLRLATQVDLDNCDDGCQCSRCTSLCWRAFGNRCTGMPVDWRRRALDAETSLDALREAMKRHLDEGGGLPPDVMTELLKLEGIP